jgi:cardiolipin synthase A/B
MFWIVLLLLLFFLHGVTLSIFVILERRQPAATLAWIVTLLFVPFLGSLLYYLFGRLRFDRRRRLRSRALAQLEMELDQLEEERVEPFSETLDNWMANLFIDEPTVEPENEADRALIGLALRVGATQVFQGNGEEVLCNAQQAYPAIEEAIQLAQHHIHLEYYIFRPDNSGRWLRDLLVERARHGVEVRLLYDGIGSHEIDEEFLRPLVEAGGKASSFSPLRFPFRLRRSKINFRNHRKIIVIDGRIGFTGGLNIGDEYQGHDPHLGFWRDTHLKIEGPAVRGLQQIFAEDWCYGTRELLIDRIYYPLLEGAGSDLVQIIPSGPDQNWEPIRRIYFFAIVNARNRVWITTPYFVPDEAILTALTTAALRGVDVRLLLPNRSDLSLVTYAGRSYYRDLLRAGVRIYEYQKGLLHAKTLVVDGTSGTIGSANMDIRSFSLNFEVNAFVYGPRFAEALEDLFLADLQDAHEIDLLSHFRRPFLQRFGESAARILSPLL